MADNLPPEGQELDSFNQALPSKRRKRTLFSKEQLSILINAFGKDPYPGIKEREELAARINTDESRVQVWFQNRRMRQKQKQTLRASTSPTGQMGEENLSPSEILEEDMPSPADTSRSPFWPGEPGQEAGPSTSTSSLLRKRSVASSTEPGQEAGPSTSCLTGRRCEASSSETTVYPGCVISQSSHCGSSQTTRLSPPLQPCDFPRPVCQGNSSQCGSFWVQHEMKESENYGSHPSFYGGVKAALQDQEEGTAMRQLYSNRQPPPFQGTHQLPPELQPPHPQQPPALVPPVPQPPPQLQQPYSQQPPVLPPSVPHTLPQLQQPPALLPSLSQPHTSQVQQLTSSHYQLPQAHQRQIHPGLKGEEQPCKLLPPFNQKAQLQPNNLSKVGLGSTLLLPNEDMTVNLRDLTSPQAHLDTTLRDLPTSQVHGVAHLGSLTAQQGQLGAQEGNMTAQQEQLCAQQGNLTDKQGQQGAHLGHLTAQQGHMLALQGHLADPHGHLGYHLGDLTVHQGYLDASQGHPDLPLDDLVDLLEDLTETPYPTMCN